MSELDRILLSEPRREPSPRFAEGVLRAARRAVAPPPLALPWRRLAAGLGLPLAVAVAVALRVALGAAAPGSLPAADGVAGLVVLGWSGVTILTALGGLLGYEWLAD